MRRLLAWTAAGPALARFLAAAAAAVAVTVTVAVALGGGAQAAPAGPRRQLGAGLSIVVPARWHVALRLTGLSEPYERFTLASFPLRRAPRARLDCGPSQAVDSMPADGALAFVIEYPSGGAYSRGFPRAPKRFVLPPGPARRYDCFPRGWLLRFRVGARPFQIMLALGRRAGPNRLRLLRALGSLRVATASGSVSRP